MDKLIISKINNVFIQIECDDGIAMELAEHFKFRVPGYQFMPAFKNKMWDGYIRLFDRRTHQLYAGLYHYVKEFADERTYDIEFIGDGTGLIEKQKVDIDEILKPLTITAGGKPIELYAEQVKGVLTGLENTRALLLSPTSSGKSLIIYVMIRYFLDMYDDDVLLIVPRTSLVEQMYSDFEDYSEQDPFNVEENFHKIYAGADKNNFKQRVVISTWQSIRTLKKPWFQRFGMVIGDEAHDFQAKSLTGIMERCTETKYRIGLTGTLNDSTTHRLVLEGLFGKVNKITTTKKLMEQGKVAKLKIQVLLLKYKDAVRKACARLSYPDEIDLIVSLEERNKFITNLACDLKGNTLVLFQYVEKHGKPLYEMIKEKAGPNRKVFYVSGETKVDVREGIRALVEKENDAIIVASFGTFSTGINIKRVHNIIFASPSKSIIKILQSIGRVLRLSGDGIDSTVYDLSDDMSWKSHKNYALKHGKVRVDLYSREEFDYKIYEVDL